LQKSKSSKWQSQQTATAVNRNHSKPQSQQTATAVNHKPQKTALISKIVSFNFTLKMVAVCDFLRFAVFYDLQFFAVFCSLRFSAVTVCFRSKPQKLQPAESRTDCKNCLFQIYFKK
jgi:hypothetical protein